VSSTRDRLLTAAHSEPDFAYSPPLMKDGGRDTPAVSESGISSKFNFLSA